MGEPAEEHQDRLRGRFLDHIATTCTAPGPRGTTLQLDRRREDCEVRIEWLRMADAAKAHADMENRKTVGKLLLVP